MYYFGVLASISKSEFCGERKRNDYFQELLFERTNRIATSSNGGIANQGSCWWQTRFQRTSTYLTTFRPGRAKPSKKAVKKIIRKIWRRNRVVVIPGYSNIFEFTTDHAKEVTKSFKKWQIIDGIFKFAWVKGLYGKSKVSKKSLKKKIEFLYEQVVGRGRIVASMLQMPGVPAHSWLVVDMTKNIDGYSLVTLDGADNLDLNTVEYKFGDQTMYNSGVWGTTRFVPYPHYTSDIRRFKRVIRRYCR